jgi:tetratricopeptide (TPR) repeat protein
MVRVTATPVLFVVAVVLAGGVGAPDAAAQSAQETRPGQGAQSEQTQLQPLQQAPDPAAAVRAEAAAVFLEARLDAAEGAFQAALDAYRKADQLVPRDPWPDLERARLLLRLHQHAAAITIVEEVIARDPDLVDARALLAEVLLEVAEDDPKAVAAAEAALRDLIQRDGYSADHAFDLARLLQSAGRVNEAIDVLGTAVTLRPDPRLQSVRVRLLLEAEREEEAATALRELLEVAPGALEERLMLVEILSRGGDHQAAAATLEAAPDLAGDRRLRRRLAWERAQASQPSEALEVIAALAAEGPIDARLLMLQAELLAGQGKTADAIAALRQALVLEPASAEIATALAQALSATGQREAARLVLAEAAGRLGAAGDNTGGDDLRRRLALDLLANGDFTAALAAAESASDPAALVEVVLDALLGLGRFDEVVARAETVTPATPATTIRRAEALFRLGRDAEAGEAIAGLLATGDDLGLRYAVVLYQRLGRHSDALPLLEELGRREPESLDVAFRRAAALERSGSFEEAEAAFRELLGRAPDLHPALNYLGYMLAERGLRLEEAVDLVQRALVLDPDNGAYRDSLGWALHRLGRHDEALVQLERALFLSPGEPTILDHLGDVLAALGRLGPAREAWQRALDNGIEEPEVVRRKLEAPDGDG